MNRSTPTTVSNLAKEIISLAETLALTDEAGYSTTEIRALIEDRAKAIAQSVSHG